MRGGVRGVLNGMGGSWWSMGLVNSNRNAYKKGECTLNGI